MGQNKGADDEIDFQTDYLADIVKESKYGYDIDTAEMFHAWEKFKADDILTYRNKSHSSKFTGTQSPMIRTPYMEAMDDSLESFLKH